MSFVRYTSGATNIGSIRGTVLGTLQSEHIYDGYGVVASMRAGRATSGVPSATSVITLDAELYSYKITKRDAAGRITARTETVNGVATNYEYAYDLAGQLKRVWINGSEVSNYNVRRERQSHVPCSHAGRRLHRDGYVRRPRSRRELR